MNNQRLHVSYICKQGEQLQVVDEVLCLLSIALDFEGEDRAAAVGEVLRVQFLLLRIIGYRRMMNLLYLWMIVQILYDLQSILYMALYTERQCLQSLQEEECMERGNGCSGVTQKDGTNLGYKCCRSYGLGKADAMVAGVRLRQ